MRSVKKISWFWSLVVMLSQFHLLAANKEATHTVVTFCVPQNNVYPFFIKENDSLTGINPDMMRQIFDENTLADVTLSYVTRPWKRCILDLQKGTVDMMIGGFNAKWENLVFPSKLGFNLKDSAISTADVCFTSVAGVQMKKVRSGMQRGTPFIVGIEAGFSKQHSSKIRPQWVELFNPAEKYRLLEMGRIDAIIEVCAMDGVPIETNVGVLGFSNFETLFPPYLSNPAYVVFSENFVERHIELAKRIIRLSQNIDKAQVYRRYQPKG